MSTMVGADVAELRELAGVFDARAGMLRALEANLNWRIHSAPWDGSDVNRFQSDWNSRHRRVMIAAAASIADAAQVLRANADQQEQASAAGFVGQVASVPALRAAEQQRVQACQAQTSAPSKSWIEGALDFTGGVVTLGGAVIDGHALWSVFSATEGLNLRSYPMAEKFIESSSRSLGELSAVGKVLGPIGVGFDALEFAGDMKDGDGWGMAWSGTSAVVGGAAWGVGMLAAAGIGGAAIAAAAPVLAAGAIVVGVGSLVYHNREAIGRFATATGQGIATAATWAASKSIEIGKAYVDVQVQTAKAVAAGVSQAVDGASRAVGAVAEQGRKFVEGIIRRPSWAPW